MADTIRFGIIGAGSISFFHAQAIKDAAGAELVSVLSPRQASLDAFTEKYPARTYTDIAAFLADPELDAVTIATPTGKHLETVAPSARAGKHVLCEKPLETTPERAQQVIDVCRENKVTLAPVFQFRYSPAAQLVKKALNNGRFGKPLMANARIKWFRPQSYYDSGAWRGTWELDGGGCLMNQSIHAIDLLLHFGGKPTEVYGYTATAAHERIAVEDNAVAALRFESGAFGVIESSTACSPGWPLEVEVSGTRGTAAMRGETIVKWDFVDAEPVDAEAAELMKIPAEVGGSSDPKQISVRGHTLSVEDMVRAIRTGDGNLIDPAEAKMPIELICGIYEAVRTGRPTAL